MSLRHHQVRASQLVPPHKAIQSCTRGQAGNEKQMSKHSPKDQNKSQVPKCEQKDIDAKSEESEGPLGHAVPERMQVGHHKLHKREVQDDPDGHFDHHVTVSQCLELWLSLCLFSKPWPLPATVARPRSPLPIYAKQNLQIRTTNLRTWNKQESNGKHESMRNLWTMEKIKFLDWHAIKFNVFHSPNLTNLISANQFFLIRKAIGSWPSSNQVREDFEAESCDWFAAWDFTYSQFSFNCFVSFLVKSHLYSPAFSALSSCGIVLFIACFLAAISLSSGF